MDILDDKLEQMIEFCKTHGLVGLEIEGMKVELHPDSVKPAGKAKPKDAEFAEKIRNDKYDIIKDKKHPFKRK